MIEFLDRVVLIFYEPSIYGMCMNGKNNGRQVLNQSRWPA